MKRDVRVFETSQHLIQNGDLLLFRPKRWSLIARAICVAGRSDYSHAAMAGWRNGDLLCLEVAGGVGGRITALAYHVEIADGRIDVFRPCPIYQRPRHNLIHFSGEKAVDEMIKIIKPGEYGYWNLFVASLRHLPFVRWFSRIERDVHPSNVPFCSQAYAEAIRRVYADPVPHCPNGLVEPGDLARSALVGNYQFTLAAEE